MFRAVETTALNLFRCFSKHNFYQTVENADINELVGQIARLLFPAKNIHIKIAGKLPVIRTRKFRIEQIFQNLISNAIKYNDKEERRIEIGFSGKDDYYVFYIEDNGRGITDTDKSEIFKQFHTAQQKAERETSTGYGLNIIKMMVEEQGGKIWFESVYGQGDILF